MRGFRSWDFKDIFAKNYEDWFKLLYVIEENLADIFETHGACVYAASLWHRAPPIEP